MFSEKGGTLNPTSEDIEESRIFYSLIYNIENIRYSYPLPNNKLFKLKANSFSSSKTLDIHILDPINIDINCPNYKA